MPPRIKQIGSNTTKEGYSLEFSTSSGLWEPVTRYHRVRKVISPNQPPGFSGSSGAAWTSANLALFVPVFVEEEVTTSSIAITNGSTVSGNFDLGIYQVDGTRVSSTGPTSHSGANQTQSVSLSVTLSPGRYFLAVVFDNTTAIIEHYTQAPAGYGLMLGVKSQTSAYPLPATATFSDPSLADADFPAVVLLV